MRLLVRFVFNRVYIIFLLKMNQDNKSSQLVLAKIRANTEHLTNIIHQNQSHNFIWCEQLDLRVCSFSASKLLVQLTYLLYTCSVMRVNLYISTEPVFVKKRLEQLLSPSLKFFLDEQSDEYPQKNEGIFRLWEWNSFDSQILPLLVGLTKKLFNSLAEKPQDQWGAKIGLKGLIENINKKISPRRLSNPDLPVIKLLEGTDVFRKNSDLLIAFNNSLFYQLRKNTKCMGLLRAKKRGLAQKMDFINRGVNIGYAFRMLDDFFNELINSGLLGMQKSSTKDYKDSEGLNVGYVEPGNQRVMDRYIARFYNYETVLENQEEISPENQPKRERNNLILEYSVHKMEAIVRLATPLEANSESIDIISIHCSNIMAGSSSITLQTMDSVRNTSQGVATRKFVTFKSYYRLQPHQEPLTCILLLIQHVILCGHIFLEILIKRPRRDQSANIQECNLRLEHLCKTVLHKAQAFYSKL